VVVDVGGGHVGGLVGGVVVDIDADMAELLASEKCS